MHKIQGGANAPSCSPLRTPMLTVRRPCSGMAVLRRQLQIVVIIIITTAGRKYMETRAAEIND